MRELRLADLEAARQEVRVLVRVCCCRVRVDGSGGGHRPGRRARGRRLLDVVRRVALAARRARLGRNRLEALAEMEVRVERQDLNNARDGAHRVEIEVVRLEQAPLRATAHKSKWSIVHECECLHLYSVIID